MWHDRPVAWTEIMPPLGNAVCLVKCSQGYMDIFHVSGKRSRFKSLRGNEDKFICTRSHLFQSFLLLTWSERTVDICSRNAECMECIHLVLHKGNERGNNKCGTVHGKPRYLIAQGLSPSRWHDGKRV